MLIHENHNLHNKETNLIECISWSIDECMMFKIQQYPVFSHFNKIQRSLPSSNSIHRGEFDIGTWGTPPEFQHTKTKIILMLFH